MEGTRLLSLYPSSLEGRQGVWIFLRQVNSTVQEMWREKYTVLNIKLAQLSPDASGNQGACCKTVSNNLAQNKYVPLPLQRFDENLRSEAA